MNDMQLYLSIGIPTITVLVGILLNQSAIHRSHDSLKGTDDSLRGELGGLRGELGGLRAELQATRSEILSRLQVVEGDLRRFYQILGEHNAKIENLEKRAG